MAFFSLEMSDVQLTNRLISNACKIEGMKLVSGQLDGPDLLRLDKKIQKLIDAPLYIDDTAGLSIMDLRSKVRRLVREHGVKLVMIDYLQLMTASGMKFNMLALSQLNRNVESRNGAEGKRPQLSDLKRVGSYRAGC